MSRRYLVNPLTQPTSGAKLKAIRIAAGISLKDFANVYAGGTNVERIAAIESAGWLRWNTAQAYRLTVTGITTMRSHRPAK